MGLLRKLKAKRSAKKAERKGNRAKMKAFRGEKRAARKAKRAGKKQAKADMLSGKITRKEMRAKKKEARKGFKSAKKESKARNDVKSIRKGRAKKVARAAAAVATGGKSEIARGAGKGLKKIAKKVKEKKPLKSAVKKVGAKAGNLKTKAKSLGSAAKAKKQKIKGKLKAAGQAFAAADYGQPHMSRELTDRGPMDQFNKQGGTKAMSPAPGMYGKGSKISYGNYSAPKMGSYAKHGGKGSPSMHKMPSFIKGKKK